MPREIRMPKLSDTMEEGRINAWRKREGDAIAKGDVLLDVETDKADMEYEAYVSGTLARILVQAGETVPVGAPIAIVRLERDTDAEVEAFLAAHGRGGAPALAPAAPAAAPAPAPPVPPSPRPASAAPAPAALAEAPPPPSPRPRPSAETRAGELLGDTSGLPFFFPDPARLRATPRARVLAQERGVDLSEISGSGPDAAVLVSDVERYLAALDAETEPALPGDVPATPVAQRIAAELGIDLAGVKGTGPGGRVTKADLREHVARHRREGPARAAALYGDEIRLSQKRRFLISQMVESKRNVPHFYLSMEIDAAPLAALRDRLRAAGQRVTFTHLVAMASVLALRRHPEVNATFREDRIVRFQGVHLAVAVSAGDELVAPVVRDCQDRELSDLAAALDAAIEKARARKLRPEDYADGTFTISNLGMFGIDQFYAIITPPQSTVLSVGSVRRVPVADGDSVRVAPRMNFGLAVDHRVLDGVKAAQFLADLRSLLEAPESLAAPAGDGA